MVSKEVIKFIKKEDILQEYVSRGGNLPIMRIKDMLQKFQDKERGRVVRIINKLKEAIKGSDTIKTPWLLDELKHTNFAILGAAE